jgi:2-polyprenyl-3-methyl-5-hydroxy-6-metoxy-1,4-benzoquinol methylase
LTTEHLVLDTNIASPRNHYLEQYWKECALRLLLKHMQPTGQSVLDYGCGRGETLGLFGDAGFSVTGTDPNRTCVSLSSSRGRAILLESDDILKQFGAKSFDIVTSLHTLEHVENPKATLTMLGEIARKYVLIAVPNLCTPEQLFQRRSVAITEGHLVGWDHRHLLNLAQRHCALELVEWTADAVLVPFTGKVFRVIGRIAPNRRRPSPPERAIHALETGLLRRLFPMQSLSIIGLFGTRCT